MRRVFAGVWRWPRALGVGLVRLYQWTVSPALGPCCRFSPSCSHYTVACLQDHGLLVGGILGARRILRCTPWSRGGYDPPPAVGSVGVRGALFAGTSVPATETTGSAGSRSDESTRAGVTG